MNDLKKVRQVLMLRKLAVIAADLQEHIEGMPEYKEEADMETQLQELHAQLVKTGETVKRYVLEHVLDNNNSIR